MIQEKSEKVSKKYSLKKPLSSRTSRRVLEASKVITITFLDFS